PDAVFLAIAATERVLTPDTAGHVNMVRDLVSSHDKVGKFGWKCQNPNLFQFSADAYFNEMGITNILFPNENCPNGDCTMLACNPVPGINDQDNDTQKFADFMAFLAPPPRGAVTGQALAGEVVFVGLGCANCHLPTLKTGPNAVKALDRVTFSPFSDFLVHDMGSLGDGIQQGNAGIHEFRTTPLWGVRHVTRLLHDGRAATLEEAILAHDGQGKGARDRFAALKANQKALLVAFLKSL
ncbi:MAG TPA: di-heme oxidoredictase family protein, partial [Thermoanaerobaculia bacterium]|nr:di-heme oxidoredictase family protein [Thermoanaerobaculia bacterium]